MEAWKLRAKRLKSEIHALYLAARDPRTPWYAKILSILIGFSPGDRAQRKRRYNIPTSQAMSSPKKIP
jgi:hypothetical protein